MRNIIISGGELFNKGAQAMTFITVSELKRIYPDHRILVLSPLDKHRPIQQQRQYAFQFIDWYPMKYAYAQKDKLIRSVCWLRNRKELEEVEAVYRNCDLLVDISGYALGAEWDYRYCNSFLEHLEFAKAFHVPIVLMPQSFGPFPFSGEKAHELDRRIREVFPYIGIICAREMKSYTALIDTYNLKNVVLKKDIVLNIREVNYGLIYNSIPQINLPEICQNAVGIIPNQRLLKYLSEEKLLAIYKDIIDELLNLGKNIYILRHAQADQALSKRISVLFFDNNRVRLIDQDFNVMEFEILVSRFQFFVVSRYHAIVHAYKHGIPCISLGWAEKYRELLETFRQEQFLFDVRCEYDRNQFLGAVDKMDQLHTCLQETLHKRLEEYQRTNIFEEIFGSGM